MRRNLTGHRVGQDHHRAKLTDDQVRTMRAVYAERRAKGFNFGYGAAAAMFGCSPSTARDVILLRTRVL